MRVSLAGHRSSPGTFVKAAYLRLPSKSYNTLEPWTHIQLKMTLIISEACATAEDGGNIYLSSPGKAFELIF